MGYNIVKNNYYYKTCEACGDDNFFYLMPDLSMWKCINDLEHAEIVFGVSFKSKLKSFEQMINKSLKGRLRNER